MTQRHHLRRYSTALAGIVLTLATIAPAAEPVEPVRPAVAKADIERMMKELSNWGRWGADDQLGALNLVTPETRRRAAGLVKDGQVVSLGKPLVMADSRRAGNAAKDAAKEGSEEKKPMKPYLNDFLGPIHSPRQTHLDALCHLAFQGKFYNGVAADDPASRLSIGVARLGFVGRGVLLDMVELLGKDGFKAVPVLPEHFDAWEKKTGLRLGPGDCVLVRTGRTISRTARTGLHPNCAAWLKTRDVAVVGTDVGLDIFPSYIDGAPFPVHVLLLDAMGVYVIDDCALEELARKCGEKGRYEFLLMLGPIDIPHGTGSPVNPLVVF